MSVRLMLVVANLIVLASFASGCNGRPGSEVGPSGRSGAAPLVTTIKRVSRETLPPVDDYLGVALDDGRVRIAPPSQWIRAPRSTKYLAAFLQTRKSQVPRIVVNADNSPYADFTRVGEENVIDFAAAVTKHLQQSGTNVVEAPLPMMIGPNAYARYVDAPGQHSGVHLQRQVLATVFDNRLYEVELWVFKDQILKSRDFAYAVAGALEFQQPTSGAATSPFAGSETSGEAGAEPVEATARE